MAKILIQFAHPLLSKSRVQAVLLRYGSNLNDVTINDLYERYPDLYIDVEREQRLLLAHDVIIFQHPFYWYSSPAIIKQWFDLVLEHNWAYGANGQALAGKKMLNVISCGGTQEAYQSDGSNRYSINQFLAPFDQTAVLCRMTYLPPFVIHATHRLTPDQIDGYGQHYRVLLSALVSERIAPADYEGVHYLNELVAGLTGQTV